ncbi:MAG: hypothetical protein RI894_1535, partial [Bacteroidota bacterium]
CGAFDVYFEDRLYATPNHGHGATAVSDGFYHTMLGQGRRDALCRVLNYITTTFNIAAPTNPANRLQLYIDRSFCTTNPLREANAGWLARAAPVYPNASTSGVYNGHLFNHIQQPNTVPDLTNFDAHIEVNFYGSTNGAGVLLRSFVYYTDANTAGINACQYDLESILLHEIGHTLGVFSLLHETSTSNFNPSGWDGTFTNGVPGNGNSFTR